MKFKNVNCVFCAFHREGQIASTFEEVKAVCEQNGILKSAWYNAMRYVKPAKVLLSKIPDRLKKCFVKTH